MKLDIGSGGKSNLGGDWLGIDLYAVDADYNWSMDKLPIADNKVEEIYSCHALEHISRHHVTAVLKEWHRVLIPGGKVTLLVPDLIEALDGVMQALEKKDLNFFEWRCHFLFGKQDHPGNFHLCGFTPWLLDHYFGLANLTVEKREFIRKHDIRTWVWVGRKE